MRISDWSSDVCSSDLKRITDIAAKLVSVGIATARVEGHSDSTGTSAYNLWLSQARAEAVATPMQAGGMRLDRKGAGSGKRVSVRVELGGRRIIKKKKQKQSLDGSIHT